MKLQTQIPLQPEHHQIDYDSRLFLMGSCFVEHIGAKLMYFKFQAVQNPFGIIFQPKAIEKVIAKAIHNDFFTEEDVFFHNERWHCFDVHSTINAPSSAELITRLNAALQLARQEISAATHSIITLGTAWAYRYVKNGELVANCHKVPQQHFIKELLPVEEILESLQALITHIKVVNPKSSIILTVSPVRHLKDGFVENQRSKAHLIAAVHRVVSPQNGVYYFPSYEMMMDELRDYRFYAEDMVHPNAIAINYIWEKFKEVWIAGKAFSIMEKIEEIQRGLAHKPFHPDSEQHQSFLKQLQAKIETLQQEQSNLSF